MASTYINSEQITTIASNLKTKGDHILNQYKSDCTTALNMSTECLQLSGLDTTEFFKALESIYAKLNDRITQFADFLTNKVAAEYDFTSQAITVSFNNEFANDISSLLGISVGGSGGETAFVPITSSNNTTTPGPVKAPSAKKPTPVIMTCSGYYKAVTNCSGGTSYVKIGNNETVVRNCSGQLTVIDSNRVAGSSSASSTSSSTSNRRWVSTSSGGYWVG